MREILFRGKKVNKDKWIYGVPVKGTEDDESEMLIVESVFNCEEYLCRGCVFDPVIPETVGQFTGLTDKNGNKIFEGDIVKCRHTIRLLEPKEKVLVRKNPRRGYGIEAVKREDPIYRLYRDEDLYDLIYFRNYVVKADIVGQRTRLQNGSDKHYLSNSYVSNHEIEVIGNIHDNPELLEG